MARPRFFNQLPNPAARPAHRGLIGRLQHRPLSAQLTCPWRLSRRRASVFAADLDGGCLGIKVLALGILKSLRTTGGTV